MNPLRAWKAYRQAATIRTLLQEAQMGKVPWTSKTLWFNVLTAAATLLGYLPLDPATALLVTSAINAALRLITRQPITFTPSP